MVNQNEETDPVRMVRAHLARALASGAYGPGARLPTERALAAELTVSRSAVRDALTVLEMEGRLTRIVGSGTYVSEAPPAPSAWSPLEASPAEILDARGVLEPAIARLAVIMATAADLARIEECHRAASETESLEEFERWDAAFHEAIVRATHNSLLEAVYASVTQARRQAEWGELKRRSLTRERCKRYADEHGRIVKALRARDAELADRSCAEHLRTVRTNLLGT